MKEYKINGITYELTHDEREAFDIEEVTEKLTDYYENFDIIVGDIAYGKLRLKGFNERNNENFKPLNDARKIDEYLAKNCAYGCKWFSIKRKK